MCTLTIFPLGQGRYRLAFNRDEARSRAPAEPPHRRRFGNRAALLPIDPVGRGTWVGVNDAGLALALLNVNPRDNDPSGWVTRHHSPPALGTAYSVLGTRYSAGVLDRPRLRSRGTIIPALLTAGSLAAALRRAAEMPVHDFTPFRLVLFADGEIAEWQWDGRGVRRIAPARLTGPVMFTSSGLGDDLVEAPRRQLFEGLVRQPGDAVARQDAFHRHSWPDRPHLSVCMRRADACTVSHTVLGLSPSDVVLTYYTGAPDHPASAVTDRLRFGQ